MSALIHKLRGILTKDEIMRYVWLFFAILFMGFFEVIGIASIMPFMELVSNPDSIQDNQWLLWVYEALAFEDARSFLIAAGAIVLILLATSNTVSAVTKWLQYKVVWSSAHGLSSRMMKTYMNQPYEFFLRNNTSDLGAQLLYEVTQLARFVLLPLTEVAAKSFVAVAIVILLFVVDPKLTFTVMLVLGGTYLTIFYFARKYLSRLGKTRFDANQARFRSANEALGGIKTVKILGREPYFLERFVKASRRFSNVIPKAQAISITPRYIVETLAFGGIIMIILYLLAAGLDLNGILPLLSLYALAGYRLLPALQLVFNSWSQIRYNHVVVEEIYRDLNKTKPILEAPEGPPPSPLTFEKDIEIRNLSFKYDGSEEVVLHDINLVIPKDKNVAFVGPTGSGKTTLVDLIVGLLEPYTGEILIDGTPLTPQNVRQWQKIAGYVPQEVLLYDDTIAKNIVFGLPELDLERVKQAAQVANIHDFIENELEAGYETVVGERGVRLSGGQRQRIGMARALYRFPQLLVLDEATSALDGITEKAVMQAISQLGHTVTKIQIAHRLNTVQDCDHIYLLDGGKVVAEGTYDDLVNASSVFRAMAKVVS